MFHRLKHKEHKGFKVFRSIRFKLTLTLMLVLVLWMALTWGLSHLFLERFYLNKINQVLVDSYEEINTMVGDITDSDELGEVLKEKFYTNNNIDVIVASFLNDDTVKLEFSTSSDGYMGKANMEMLMRLAFNAQSSEAGKWRYNTPHDSSDSFYVIQKNHDNLTSSDYLNLIGTLDNGHVIVIQTPIESIRTSAKISNTLLAYIGLILTVFGCLIMFFISNSYAKPIHRMAMISKRMSNLEFDVKISDFRNDEIGELGQSMNELADKLELTISELKTANNELRKDIDQKIQIDEMRKEFLSHVSHELKTPIALIQGYAEGLKDNILDDEESKEFYCDVIIDEASKMNKMVKNLMTLNELEFGTDQVQFEHFDFSELVQNLVQQSNILIQKQGVTVVTDIPKPLYVWADEFKIEGVLTNYMNNALHYVSKQGCIRIYSVQRENDVRIYVYNSGNQIAQEELDKLWIKFYKVDKARSREYGGNGIGLSIVAATMRAHGKAYGVENVEGGVQFYFDLDIDNGRNNLGVNAEESTAVPDDMGDFGDE